MLKETIVAQSDRVIFKHFSSDDIDGFYRLNANPENLKYTGDIAFKNRQETADFIANYNHYTHHGFGRWSLYLKESQQYIGFCGLRCCSSTGRVDLGYRIDQRYWGKGLATEVANCAVNVGFFQFGLDVLFAKAQEANLASIRVLQKLGFSEVGCEKEKGIKWKTFSLSKPLDLSS